MEEDNKKDPNIEEQEKSKAEIIAELKQQIASITAERDKFKTERDQANANLLNMEPKVKGEEKSEFDKIFGGLR